MTDDLIAQIRAYSQQLAEEMIPVGFEEGVPVSVVDRVPHRQVPPARTKWVVALAGAVTVLLFGLLAWLLRSNEAAPVAVTPTTFISPTPTTGGDESSDLFTPIEGWIIYRSGFESPELIAVDPKNPEDKRSLGAANDLHPIAWSADGTRLLLTTQGPYTEAPAGGDLYYMIPSGSVVQHTEGSTSFGGSLSPLGGVAYIDLSENQNLFVSDTVGRFPPRVVATSDGGTWLEHPAWSPDGSQIAFVGYHELGGSWSIEVVNADGTERHVIRDPGRLRVIGLAWSPDGSQLAFSGEEWDQSQGRSIEGVFVIDMDGSEPRQLTNIEGVQTVHDCCSVAWSPDGSRIAFLRNSGLTDLFTVAADGSDEQEIESVFVTETGTIAWHPG
jgi:Tol biopolymer transport system component